MSDQSPPFASRGDLGEQPTAREVLEAELDAEEPEVDDSLRTGNARVDAVLDSLTGLAEAPVDDHVRVFEQAHDELRRALDAPADGGSAGGDELLVEHGVDD
jgi:hypothetical protein